MKVLGKIFLGSGLVLVWAIIIGIVLPIAGLPLPWRAATLEALPLRTSEQEIIMLEESIRIAVEATVAALPTPERQMVEVEVIVTATPGLDEVEFVLESADPGDLVPSSLIPSADPTQLLVPTVTNKQFDSGRYEDFIWWDVTYDTQNLKKPTRAVKGFFVFSDLFGEPQFLLNTTINDPIMPGEPFSEQGIGFEYNEFIDSHDWVRFTELKDMTIAFVVDSIIYEDGEREDFDTPAEFQ